MWTAPSRLLAHDLGDWRGQRKDDMEVGHRQQLGLPRGEPFGAGQALALRAVPVAAGVVGDTDQTAVRAALDVATEHCRPARLDGAHDAMLDTSEMPGMRLPIGPPWRRKTSATSSVGGMGPAQAGGTTSSRSRSSGLVVLRIVV